MSLTWVASRARRLPGAIGWVTLILLAALGGCGGGSDGTTVDVSMREYEITANLLEVPPGEVSFDIRNEGGIPHEFAVVRTDSEPGKLPTNPDGTAQLDAPGERVVGRVVLAPGGSTSLQLKLSGGSYVLVCNLAADAAVGTPAHYHEGMYSSLVVTR